MRSHQHLVSLSLAALLLTTSQISRADKAAARVLFDDGMSLMKEQKYSEACPKFEESNRQDPSLGAQFQLGACYDKIGRSASAWALFQSVADQAERAGDPVRARVAHNHANDMKSKLSFLEIDVEAAVPGLTVLRNDQPVGSPLWGMLAPADPGTLNIVATAPGFQTWRGVITLGPTGDRKTITVPELTCEVGKHRVAAGCEVCTATDDDCETAPAPLTPTAPAPVTSATVDAVPSTGASTVGTPPSDTPLHVPTLSWVLGGAGVVSLGAAGIIEAIGASKWSSSTGHCHADTLTCDPTGHNLQQQATNLGTVATVGLVAGGLLLVGGVTFAVISGAKSESGPTASLIVHPMGVSVVGRF